MPVVTVTGMTTQSNSSTLAVPARRRLRAGADRSPGQRLPVLLAGTFMVVLDFFIVNVALPSMQRDLHAGTGAIEWVVAGFALTSAVFLITAARLGDRIGRRRTFSIGLGVFTLASAACGAAGSPTVLVAARLAQGIGAALVMPSVLSIINVTYTGPDLPRALGIYGLVMGLAAACGQLIGGGLIQADVAGLGWRLCFLINVPVGIAALALAPRFVPESRSERRTAARSDRDAAAHRRADGGRAAARRGPTARLAGVDLDLVRASLRCCCWASPRISAVSPAAAASRCCRRRCSAPARSPPGC